MSQGDVSLRRDRQGEGRERRLRGRKASSRGVLAHTDGFHSLSGEGGTGSSGYNSRRDGVDRCGNHARARSAGGLRDGARSYSMGRRRDTLEGFCQGA